MTERPPALEPPLLWCAPAALPPRRLTRRLLLRYWEAEDAAAMLAAIDVDRGLLMPWLLPWVRVDNHTVAQCIFNIERFRREREQAEPAPTSFAMGIFDGASGVAVGGTGFHRVDRGAHQAEIGYWIRADRRCQGLCTEAVAGLLSWGFTSQAEGGWGFRRLEVACAGANVASRAVPRKLGLRHEVHEVAHRWVEGIGWDDTLGWGVLAEEWDATADVIRPSARAKDATG